MFNRWAASQPGTWKINVDGAFWEKERKGAWGFVVRGDQGNAVIAGAGSLNVVMDSARHCWTSGGSGPGDAEYCA